MNPIVKGPKWCLQLDCIWGKSPFDKNLCFSKIAADRGISLLCFFEVEVIVEVKSCSYRDDNYYY